jgi:AcrR family transcriptional regulator
LSTSSTTPRRSYGGVPAAERTELRRRQLLDAALARFGSNGYGATGVKDVCGEAGLTHRYFYESFADREALFLAVFDDVIEELFTLTAGAVAASDGGAEDQLRRAISAFLTTMAEDPRKARIVFAEPPAVGPTAERHMRTALRRFEALVEATARLHLPADLPDATFALVAIAIVGTLERATIEWQEGVLALPVDRIAEECVNVFLAMLGGLAAGRRGPAD